MNEMNINFFTLLNKFCKAKFDLLKSFNRVSIFIVVTLLKNQP